MTLTIRIVPVFPGYCRFKQLFYRNIAGSEPAEDDLSPSKMFREKKRSESRSTASSFDFVFSLRFLSQLLAWNLSFWGYMLQSTLTG